ncbi:galactose-binding domain-like protein [Mycena pura]|uniref:Galactose-binding domain-like protein n=1 Tax=Mycena pura TaxID=153505 RepID=A0AAD6UV70_9AGAR|nr:galactose-binding domain-like protein [Mycena pura]
MATKDDVSLLEFLDLSQANCLNESAQHPFSAIFNQSVRIRSIVIKSSGGDTAPKRVKLLVNRPSIGFEDVEDAEESDVAQILDLSPDDVRQGRPMPLRFVRFQTVNSLHACDAHSPSL